MKMVGSLARSANVLDAGIGMGHEDLRVLLEDRGDVDHRDVLLDRRERAEQVALHVELDLVGRAGAPGWRPCGPPCTIVTLRPYFS